MRAIIFVSVFIVLISSQYVETKVIQKLTESEKSVAFNQDLRGLSDIWNSIKNSAKKTLNSIKNIASATKEKIAEWIKNVETRAHDINDEFNNRIKNIRNESKTILESILGAGQLVKECFKKENNAIENLLKEIIKNVSTCISDSVLNLSSLEAHQFALNDVNDTDFMNKIEIRMNKCVMEEDVEECLINIRKDLFDEMEQTEDKIMISRMESRGITDNILKTLLTCSIEGLTNVSDVIATEAIHIVACVAKG